MLKSFVSPFFLFNFALWISASWGLGFRIDTVADRAFGVETYLKILVCRLLYKLFCDSFLSVFKVR